MKKENKNENGTFKINYVESKDKEISFSKNYKRYLIIHYFIDIFTDFWAKNRHVSSLEQQISVPEYLNKYSTRIPLQKQSTTDSIYNKLLNAIKDKDEKILKKT